MPKRKQETKDAVDILHKRLYKGKPKRQTELEEARASAEVARSICALRADAGLTQAELAKLVGTSRSVISRLEDDDYDGHSLAMLRRIAAALNKRVEIRFVPAERKLKSAL
jgi:DNA-binding XRE family transcriptional regulator